MLYGMIYVHSLLAINRSDDDDDDDFVVSE